MTRADAALRNTLLEFDAPHRHHAHAVNAPTHRQTVDLLATVTPIAAPVAAYNAVTEYLDHIVPVAGTHRSDAKPPRAAHSPPPRQRSLKAKRRLLQTL